VFVCVNYTLNLTTNMCDVVTVCELNWFQKLFVAFCCNSVCVCVCGQQTNVLYLAAIHTHVYVFWLILNYRLAGGTVRFSI
jgi:hypothetical protein